MTRKRCRKNYSCVLSNNIDYMKRNSCRYNEKWIKRIELLANDFCIADDLVVVIIEETKNLYVGREREDLMYNHAHKQLMKLLKD